MFSGLFVVLALNLGCGKPNDKSAQEAKMLSAVMSGDVALVQHYDKQGYDLDVTFSNRFYWTPLITSIYLQDTNMISFLINRGVDVKKRDNNGMTALQWAIKENDTNTGKLLLTSRKQSLIESENWSVVRAAAANSASPTLWRALLEEFPH